MSYFRTAYDTTAGRIIDLSGKIELPIKEAMVSGVLDGVNLGIAPIENCDALFIIGGSTSESKIPAYIHPYLIKNFKGMNHLITDARLFRTSTNEYQSPRDFETSVRNKTEYTFLKNRAALNLLWLKEDRRSIRSRFSFACSVFAAWLSQAVAKEYALDLQDQYRLMALTIYYYHTLFVEETQLTGEALEIAVVHTIKATKFPAATVYSLYESIGEIKDISGYCEAAKVVIENVRLKDFNLAILLTIVRNSWFATNSKEILSVALEHPPTWISIVASVLMERSYRASPLFKIIDFQGNLGNASEFQMNYVEMLRTAIAAMESADNTAIEFKAF